MCATLIRDCHKMQFMPENSPKPAVAHPTTPLERALDQNEHALNTVGQSATELLVIHTVLAQEIPDRLQTGDVAQALQRTDELETKISDAAQELAQVNEVLAHEIGERVDLERELVAAKAALAYEKAKP
jgi:C4-dicarboxylate-specific signal transduction histidine kinase